MMSRRRKWRRLHMAAWLAFSLSMAGPARGATIERLSLARMAQAAPLIVRARCARTSVGWDMGEIWTFTLFDVEDMWRGKASPQITVRLLGGRVGNITSHVSGVPQFRPGDDVVLFLEPTQRGDFSVVSWEQGTFRIQHNTSGEQGLVTQDTASIATFDPATRQFRAGGIRNMPLETFRARVVAALQAAEAKKP